jgi:hypothetical protein
MQAVSAQIKRSSELRYGISYWVHRGEASGFAETCNYLLKGVSRVGTELKRLVNRSIVEPLRKNTATGLPELFPLTCALTGEVASQHE